MKTKRLVLIALMTAALCVMAPWAVPVGPVPITLATLGVYLAAGLLGARDGTISVTLYVLLGALGVPVFSGFAGGFQKLAGVTGGYITGYILCAVVVGILVDRLHRPWQVPLALLCGTGLLYAFGTVWFMLQTGSHLGASLLLCVVPFLFGDAAKIAVATAVVPPLRATLKRHGLL